ERSDFAQPTAGQLHFDGVLIGVLQKDPARAVALEPADLVEVAQHPVIVVEDVFGTAVNSAVAANVVEVLELASGEGEIARIVSGAHDDPRSVQLVDEPLCRLPANSAIGARS